jgi:hypothetical protein
MLEKDIKRLWKGYSPPAAPDSSELTRLADALGLDLADSDALGDAIFTDLDPQKHGINWWTAYPNLSTGARILMSDYLVATTRSIAENLLEARIERLEFEHAAADFRKWMERGLQPDGSFKIKPPRSPYEELAHRRVQTHLVGMLRGWGSALDCLGITIIAVAGTPKPRQDLVKADMGEARRLLADGARDNALIAQLQAALEQAEADAGPPGWRDWVLDMRNTVVHRGRRIVTWGIDTDRGTMTGFSLQLPVSPGMTEVEAVIHAGGQIASQFITPAPELLDNLSTAMHSYVASVSRVLLELWHKRRHDPHSLVQNPAQWKHPQGVINPAPIFRGFSDLRARNPVTELGVGDDVNVRLRAAAITHRVANDVLPDPRIWHDGAK